MDIKGLDYNTQREKLRMPEYGRDIQNMVDYCLQLPTKQERQRCAETIICVMKMMNPQNKQTANYEEKLWNHLAILSNYSLDIDYPFEVRLQEDVQQKPLPLQYNTHVIKKRHYGNLLEELMKKLVEMPNGDERDELMGLIANQMKRSLYMWSHGSCDDEKVASDLAEYTGKKIQLDIENFVFERVDTRVQQSKRKNHK